MINSLSEVCKYDLNNNVTDLLGRFVLFYVIALRARCNICIADKEFYRQKWYIISFQSLKSGYTHETKMCESAIKLKRNETYSLIIALNCDLKKTCPVLNYLFLEFNVFLTNFSSFLILCVINTFKKPCFQNILL